MNQKPSSFITAVFIAFLIAILLHSPSEAAVSVPGDLNGDEIVTVSDSILIARLVAEDSTLNLAPDAFENADINRDGSIDSDDITYSLRFLANMLPDQSEESGVTTSITAQSGTTAETTVLPLTTITSKATSQTVLRTTSVSSTSGSQSAAKATTVKTTKVTTKTTLKTTKTTKKTTKATTKITTKTTAKTTQKTTKTTAKTGYSYVCNTSKSSHKFHRADCPSVARMNDSNKLYVSSRDEAIAMGYEPCKNCNP